MTECLVLGPLLFILYIYQITQFSNGLDLIIFGDDTELLENEMNTKKHYQERVNDVIGLLINKSMAMKCKEKSLSYF